MTKFVQTSYGMNLQLCSFYLKMEYNNKKINTQNQTKTPKRNFFYSQQLLLLASHSRRKTSASTVVKSATILLSGTWHCLHCQADEQLPFYIRSEDQPHSHRHVNPDQKSRCEYRKLCVDTPMLKSLIKPINIPKIRIATREIWRKMNRFSYTFA